MPLLPPSTTTVLPAKRMASEHAVGIGRLLRDRLGHVPVLGDPAVLDAQYVHDRKPAIPGRELRMRVHDHEIRSEERRVGKERTTQWRTANERQRRAS